MNVLGSQNALPERSAAHTCLVSHIGIESKIMWVIVCRPKNLLKYPQDAFAFASASVNAPSKIEVPLPAAGCRRRIKAHTCAIDDAMASFMILFLVALPRTIDPLIVFAHRQPSLPREDVVLVYGVLVQAPVKSYAGRELLQVTMPSYLELKFNKLEVHKFS
mmetsp:Transcript_9532/g.15616  ORF Transcript_9532/g.15616 Transcript_9532/m.15616 type:complete len:162 (+) Transcript_9532:288-773(+)